MATFQERLADCFSKGSTKAQGDAFEVLVKEYYQNGPKSDHIKNIWLWLEWPDHEQYGREMGVDLIIEGQLGELIAVQAKGYGEQTPVDLVDVLKFDNFAKNDLHIHTKHLVTSGSISGPAQKVIDREHIKVIDRKQLESAQFNWPETPSIRLERERVAKAQAKQAAADRKLKKPTQQNTEKQHISYAHLNNMDPHVRRAKVAAAKDAEAAKKKEHLDQLKILAEEEEEKLNYLRKKHEQSAWRKWRLLRSPRTKERLRKWRKLAPITPSEWEVIEKKFPEEQLDDLRRELRFIEDEETKEFLDEMKKQEEEIRRRRSEDEVDLEELMPPSGGVPPKPKGSDDSDSSGAEAQIEDDSDKSSDA